MGATTLVRRPGPARRLLRWSGRGLLAVALLLVPALALAQPAPTSSTRGGASAAAKHWRSLQRPVAAPAPVQGLVGWRGQTMPWQLRQGRRLVEGDIDIGPHREGQVLPEGLGLAGSVALWPRVGGVAEIPYVVSQGNAALPGAIARYNSLFAGVIQWVPRAAQADYVDFALDPNDHSGSGFSALGRAGGRQLIGGSIDMSQGTLLHEMGHATGLWHEHSRAERAAHLSLALHNAIGTLAPNLDVVPLTGGGQSLGLYDIASLMHYGPHTFSKNGEPTMETLPPGMPVSELGDYSAGDLDAVRRLYGQAPSTVTVTSNPPGLQVIVDGVLRATPHTYTPALDSVHTLDVPAGPQQLNGKAYVYGRWNDARAASHAITIGRGNGLTGSPVNRPAVTVYQASFIELLKYEPFVWPEGAGSVQATPPPQAHPPLAGLYYAKRQPVQLLATPAGGQSLYRLYTADGGVSENPKTTRSPDWVLAYFTPQPVTTIATQPAGRWLWVDGGFWVGPVGFSTFYDSGWGAGSVHQVDAGSAPQQPFSWSIRHPWAGWSDGGAASHPITVPAGASTVTASFGTQYNVSTWAHQPCAGSVAVSPSPPDGFHDAGSVVSVSQATVPGWTFTGWQRDMAGTQSPAPLTMTDEHVVVADYNTSAVPIAVQALSPASRVAGQGKFTLLVNGQGFAAGTRAFVNGVFRAPASATPTQLKLKMKPAHTAAAGSTVLFVDNLPPGSWPCSAYAVAELPVRSANAQPLATASPAALKFGKVAVGGSSAPLTLTVSNPGNRTLALHDMVVTGAQAGDFAVAASTCPSGLPAGGACTLDLRFQPQALGERGATLLLINTAFDSPQAVALSGTGK
ncbi:MAG: choice-of-anchor D domain-containing protein [Pseudomonadota bacterium]